MYPLILGYINEMIEIKVKKIGYNFAINECIKVVHL